MTDRATNPWQQHLLHSILIAIAILGGFPIVGPKNFLPAPWVCTLSLYLSATSVLLFSGWVIYLARTRKINPGHPWHQYSRIKKGLTLVSCPLILWVMLHLAMGYSLPRLWTSLVSEPAIVQYQVTRTLGSGRYSCDHQLSLDKFDSFAFEFCLPEKFWHRLPDAPFIATFKVNSSHLGTTFEGVRVPPHLLKSASENL
ncbi:hypothetical protein [Marinobacter qingdaonensis]|uniref:Uncharacterized protein n=1 Tax=Marinobacter qingdaonensis TaxID=3108486 RepID=A0ABU5NYZ7_9GAMM|nr:hypothetical protein [Marinobacter sp. ASW11-75]MEA1081013.1 hypothetical protein [Marinobacter sp. ASW11-75]